MWVLYNPLFCLWVSQTACFCPITGNGVLKTPCFTSAQPESKQAIKEPKKASKELVSTRGTLTCPKNQKLNAYPLDTSMGSKLNWCLARSPTPRKKSDTLSYSWEKCTWQDDWQWTSHRQNMQNHISLGCSCSIHRLEGRTVIFNHAFIMLCLSWSYLTNKPHRVHYNPFSKTSS